MAARAEREQARTRLVAEALDAHAARLSAVVANMLAPRKDERPWLVSDFSVFAPTPDPDPEAEGERLMQKARQITEALGGVVNG